ncbi:hypothetical protein D3C73_1385390 [compost metagenome]
MSQCALNIVRVTIELRGKDKGPAVFCSQLGTFFAGPQQEALCGLRRLRCGTQAGLRVIIEVGVELGKLLRKVRFILLIVGGLQRLGGKRQPAGRFAHPQIDPSRCQCR